MQWYMEPMKNQSDRPWRDLEVLNLISDGTSLPMVVPFKGRYPRVSVRMMGRILWGSLLAKPQVYSAEREKDVFLLPVVGY